MKSQLTLLVQTCLVIGVLSCSPTRDEPPTPIAIPSQSEPQKLPGAATASRDGSRYREIYRINACRDDFELGPIWWFSNQGQALKENQWMAILGFRSFSQEMSRRDQWIATQKLRARLLFAGVEYVSTIESNNRFVVLGEPTDILALIHETCDIDFFDLAPAKCDCFDDFCSQLASCDLIPGTVRSNKFPDYESVSTCGRPKSPNSKFIIKTTLEERLMRLNADVYVQQKRGWDVDSSLYLEDEGVGMHSCFRTEVARFSYILRR